MPLETCVTWAHQLRPRAMTLMPSPLCGELGICGLTQVLTGLKLSYTNEVCQWGRHIPCHDSKISIPTFSSAPNWGATSAAAMADVVLWPNHAWTGRRNNIKPRPCEQANWIRQIFLESNFGSPVEWEEMRNPHELVAKASQFGLKRRWSQQVEKAGGFCLVPVTVHYS